MTTTQVSESKEASSARSQPAIEWIDPGIKSTYANTCTVSSTREEVVLNFGLNQSWERGQASTQVQLTDRIIMNPHTAKRLALLLNAVVQQYESRFGALDSSVHQGAGAAASTQAR